MSNASKLAPKSPAGANVQAKAEEATGGGDARIQLRGMGYDEGAAALAPGGAPVQMISGKVKKPPTPAPPTTGKKPPTSGGDGTGGGGGG